MKCVFILVCSLLCVYLNEGKDFTVGTRANNLLISTDKVKYRSIPFIRRDKDYSYIDTKERIIKVTTSINPLSAANCLDHIKWIVCGTGSAGGRIALRFAGAGACSQFDVRILKYSPCKYFHIERAFSISKCMQIDQNNVNDAKIDADIKTILIIIMILKQLEVFQFILQEKYEFLK